jgi:hypothetical protein
MPSKFPLSARRRGSCATSTREQATRRLRWRAEAEHRLEDVVSELYHCGLDEAEIFRCVREALAHERVDSPLP